MPTGIDPIWVAPGVVLGTHETNCTVPFIEGWPIAGLQPIDPRLYSPYMPAPSADVLLHAKTRLAELDRELDAFEAKRTEAEMLRRMIAAAESK
jgi:hypothetical protein